MTKRAAQLNKMIDSLNLFLKQEDSITPEEYARIEEEIDRMQAEIDQMTYLRLFEPQISYNFKINFFKIPS